MDTQAIIEKFRKYYENYSMETLNQCADFYHENLHFIDPFHEVDGRDQFIDYSQRLMKKVHSCRFEIQKVFIDQAETQGESQACVIWTMHVKPSPFQDERLLHGSTHLKINDKIYEHRDYYDTAEMIYKKIPILGGLIKAIEKRVLS